MNTGQRIAILVGAVVVLAAGFVLAQGSDDEGGREADLTPSETIAAQDEAENTETSDGTGGTEAPNGAATTKTQAAKPAPRVETVRIAGGKPASGDPKTLKYKNGDTIRLRFTSSSGSAEVHIHGYDKTAEVPDGGTETLSFKANAEGIFEVEDHHTDALLAKLEVRP